MFELKFETGNAAFHDGDGLIDLLSVYDTLRDVASEVRDGRRKGEIIDINGNAVGRWELSE